MSSSLAHTRGRYSQRGVSAKDSLSAKHSRDGRSPFRLARYRKWLRQKLRHRKICQRAHLQPFNGDPLAAETSWQTEAGARYTQGSLTGSASWFQIDRTNDSGISRGSRISGSTALLFARRTCEIGFDCTSMRHALRHQLLMPKNPGKLRKFLGGDVFT